MNKNSTIYAIPTREERKRFLEDELRERAREWIEKMVNEELDIALGIGRYERSEERKGYHKGKRNRTFTTRGESATSRMRTSQSFFSMASI